MSRPDGDEAGARSTVASSAWAATTAPSDAAPSLALAATVNTVARSAGGLWSLRAVNRPTSSGPSRNPMTKRPGQQHRPRPEPHHSQGDAHRDERRRGPSTPVGAAAARRVIASEPTSPPTAATVITAPASAAGRPRASGRRHDGEGQPAEGGEGERRRERRRRAAAAPYAISRTAAPEALAAGTCSAGVVTLEAQRGDRDGATGHGERGQGPRRGRGDGDDGDERRPGQPGDVVGERVPGVHPGRPGTTSAGAR